MSHWDGTDLTRPRDVIYPNPEQRARDCVETIARSLMTLKGGDSLKVEAHDDGTWTVTFTTTDQGPYRA